MIKILGALLISFNDPFILISIYAPNKASTFFEVY